MGKNRFTPRKIFTENWHLIVLLLIFLTAFWFRSFPARFGELQALDPFYIYRVSEYVLTHNWQLFDYDILRAYPEGNNPWKTEYLGPIYIPAFVYALGGGWGMHYLHFAIIWPAFMGALACLAMYLLGSELFERKSAGLFSAFFLATTPSFITRTSAGFFEKEPIAGVFIILSAYFFIRSFKKNSWVSGIMGGISFFIGAITWGGMRYVFLLYGAFLGTIFLAYTLLVAFDYLFSGLGKTLKRLDKFLGMEMVKAFGLTVILGHILSSFFTVHAARFGSLYVMLPLILWLILLAKNILQKLDILKENNVRYFLPGTLILALLSIVISSMFSDYVYNISKQLIDILTFQKGVIFSTVAENAPGNWNNIASMTGTGFTGNFPYVGKIISLFSPCLSLWVFMWLGIGLVIYRMIRTSDMLMFFPLIWILAAFWGVFYYIRLVFLLGPPASLIGGFFVSWLITRRSRLGITEKLRKKVLVRDKKSINIMTVILSVLVFLICLVNFANAYVYSLGLGPSICFPKQTGNSPFEVEPCVVVNENGTLTLADDQPWYDALKFMHDYAQNESHGIKQPPVVLTWWDFGYWFQTRAGVASVADGGAAGDRTAIAYWFTSDVSKWYEWEDWLKHHKVDYILMDYTLPGKYGAISKIASHGEHIYGFLQFQRKGIEPQGNKTVVIFGTGPYEIWLPMENQRIAGTPIFLIQKNGQYLQKSYINEICTANGIIRVGNEENAIPGCIAITELGVFYIPPETENTIFTDLMFMKGARLPVEKIYDSGLITIYRPVYRETPGNETLSE